MTSHDPSHTWHAVDELLNSTLGHEPKALADAAARCASVGLPAISVTPMLGKLLSLLARLTRAERVLEIGTLGGYSTLWMLEGMQPSGVITTIERDPAHAAVALANFDAAGVSHRIDLRQGAALDVLPRIQDERLGPFGMVFIDADKQNSAAYFEWALRLTSPGSVIVVDNVIREGAILNAADTDERVQGTRRVLSLIGRTPSVDSTALQTVGSKGYDGFAIALVR